MNGCYELNHFFLSMNKNYCKYFMIEFIVVKHISVTFFFQYSIQIRIDLNPWVHWGAATKTVNEKVGIKAFFYVL